MQAILSNCSKGKSSEHTHDDTVPNVLSCRLIAMNFRDRSEIKWHTLPSGDWNAKSGHICQIQFHTQLKAMPELKDMPLQGKNVWSPRPLALLG